MEFQLPSSGRWFRLSVQDGNTDPLDVLPERNVLNAFETKEIESKRQRQFLEFGKNGLGTERMIHSPDGQIHIRVLVVCPFCPRAKEFRRSDLRMPGKSLADEVQVGVLDRRGFHGE